MTSKDHYQLPERMIILVFMLLIFCISSCSSSGNGDSAESQDYTVQITYNVNDPEVYTYSGAGAATLQVEGNQVTITGTITVGQLSFSAEFEGDLDGDQFTLITTNFQVQYDFEGVTYTEDITISFPAFTIAGGIITATGDFIAITNPGATTESGTVTIVATEIQNTDRPQKGTLLTDI